MKSAVAQLSEPELYEQFGALPWRRIDGGVVEVLLVTSRISRHWLLPKGWLIKGKSGTASACREAFEEAGVEGRAQNKPIGSYQYVKITKTGEHLPCRVSVYGLQVKSVHAKWPEVAQRTRQWFSLPDAAAIVTEPGLRDFLAGLDASAFR